MNQEGLLTLLDREENVDALVDRIRQTWKEKQLKILAKKGMDEVVSLLLRQNTVEACILIDGLLQQEWTDEDYHLLALKVSVHSHNDEVYQYLIRLRPNLIHASMDGNGSTILHWFSESYPDRIPMLLEFNPNLNLKTTDTQKTALDCAYSGRHLASIRILLELGASTLIGQKRWLKDGEYFVLGRRMILKCYYHTLLSRVDRILEAHLRLVLVMLA